jgi:site-specific DNA recombinase
MERIAAYIRVSTDEQADKGNSLKEQQERLNSYCKAMGWEEPVFYIDDGYSAKNLNRPAMQRLIEDVKKGEIKYVLTTKLDRLTRNLLDLLQVVNMFDEFKCNFVSASESFDTSTAAGRMVLHLLGVFAEFERERISERVKDNMTLLAKNTTKAITQPCYGYDVVEGQYRINELEAQYVKLMFDLAENGHGHRKIAKILNERGARTKRGKMWDQTNVKRLMRTETIAGIMIYNKRENKNGKIVERDRSEWIIKENNHPAIIPIERFERVREIMQSRSRAYKHADNETYLLTGLVKCKHCGRNMRGSTSRHKTKHGDYTYYRYVCSSYILGYGCKYHAVHRDDLESTIIEQIREIAKTSTKDLHLKVTHSRTVTDEINMIKDQLSRIDKRMQKQIEAYENELISAEDLKKARERIESEREKLREQLEKLEMRKGEPVVVKDNAKLLLEDITGVDRLKAKSAIRKLIDTIELENGELISILWKS